MLSGLLNLGEIYGGRDVWLTALRQDSQPSNRWRALLYIIAAGISGLRPDLHEELAHPDSRVRAWACYALGAVGLPGAVPRLQRMTEDPSRRVRFQAVRALAAHGARRRGRPFGTGNPVVLISDDNPQVQQHLTTRFREMGVPCSAASTCEETILRARTLKPAIVITDHQKGYDNTSGLRMAEFFSKEDELKEIMLIMLSVDRIGGPFLWHGGDAFLQKNMQLDLLAPLVHEMLSA